MPTPPSGPWISYPPGWKPPVKPPFFKAPIPGTAGAAGTALSAAAFAIIAAEILEGADGFWTFLNKQGINEQISKILDKFQAALAAGNLSSAQRASLRKTVNSRIRKLNGKYNELQAHFEKNYFIQAGKLLETYGWDYWN